jgi:hypothetical protein
VPVYPQRKAQEGAAKLRNQEGDNLSSHSNSSATLTPIISNATAVFDLDTSLTSISSDEFPDSENAESLLDRNLLYDDIHYHFYLEVSPTAAITEFQQFHPESSSLERN